MNEIKDNATLLAELETLALPIRTWLGENYHSHAYVAINTESVDLGEAIMSHVFKDAMA